MKSETSSGYPLLSCHCAALPFFISSGLGVKVSKLYYRAATRVNRADSPTFGESVKNPWLSVLKICQFVRRRGEFWLFVLQTKALQLALHNSRQDNS